MSIAEVPDQQRVAEIAEPGRSQDHPPRRVQVALRHEPLLEVAAGVEHVDEPVPLASDIVFGIGVLLGVADIQFAVDRRDAERSVSRGQVRIGECAEPILTKVDLVELAVEDVDLAVVEVGGEEVVLAADLGRGNPFIDGSVGCLEADLGNGRWSRDAGHRADARIPTGDGAALRGEDENRRLGVCSIGDREVGGAASAIEQLPGRRASGDVDLERLGDRAPVHVAGVQLAQADFVGRNPERSGGWAKGDAEGVLERRVGDEGHSGQIRYQVGGQERGAHVQTIFEPLKLEPDSPPGKRAAGRAQQGVQMS